MDSGRASSQQDAGPGYRWVRSEQLYPSHQSATVELAGVALKKEDVLFQSCRAGALFSYNPRGPCDYIFLVATIAALK